MANTLLRRQPFYSNVLIVCFCLRREVEQSISARLAATRELWLTTSSAMEHQTVHQTSIRLSTCWRPLAPPLVLTPRSTGLLYGSRVPSMPRYKRNCRRSGHCNTPSKPRTMGPITQSLLPPSASKCYRLPSGRSSSTTVCPRTYTRKHCSASYRYANEQNTQSNEPS